MLNVKCHVTRKPEKQGILRENHDMSNCSDFGVSIGALMEFGENAHFNIQHQLTDDSDAFTLNVLWQSQ
jgi:hypothetical protein